MLGVIGRNGAGKSTLLKILTRITTPTERPRRRSAAASAACSRSAPASTRELTGRENIFLNGSILGMKRREISAKFDEIVEFSGVEKFIDTPVKRYSSGMYVRLAFSVAAHLEPEILLVDEVLAVGDAEFQQRCLGRMEDFSGTGRTVLFVSHNMQAMTQLCDRAILLDGGEVVAGRAERGGRHALPSVRARQRLAARRAGSESAPGDDRVRLRSVRVVDEDGQLIDTVDVRRAGRDRARASACSVTRADLPEDQGARPAGDIAFNALDTSPAGEPLSPGDHCRRHGSPRTC